MYSKKIFDTADIIVQDTSAFLLTLTKRNAFMWKLWQQLQCQSQSDFAVPRRSDLKLENLRAHSSALIILELASEQQLRIRLSGSAVDQWGGANLSGKLLSELVHPDAIGYTTAYYNTILSQPCGGFVEELLTLEDGRKFKSSFITLPFCDDTGEIIFAISLPAVERDGFDIDKYDRDFLLVKRDILSVKIFNVGYGVPDW